MKTKSNKQSLITWMTFDGRPALEHCRYEDGTVRIKYHPVKGEKWQSAVLVKLNDPRIGTSTGLDFFKD